MPGDERPQPLRVLVADDNPVVRAGLTALLGDHPDIDVVAEASNGTEAVSAAERVHPDVVLLDVRMPGTDGLTALPQLALLAPVMMLTYSSQPEIVKEALHRGASAYLVHGGFTAEELTEAVRAVGRGAGSAPAPASVPVPLPAHRLDGKVHGRPRRARRRRLGVGRPRPSDVSHDGAPLQRLGRKR